MNISDLPVLSSALEELQRLYNSQMASRADRQKSERLLAEGDALLRAERAVNPKGRRIMEILPSELLSCIFEVLEDITSIQNVRLTCVAFEKASWPAFAKSFNQHVFHPTKDSLEKLQKFAEKKDAAPYLKTLNISTVQETVPEPELPTPSRSLVARSSPDEEDKSQSQRLQELSHRHDLVTALHEAMAKLVSLETICVVERNELRFDSPQPSNPTSTSDREAQQPATAREQAFRYNSKAHRHTLEMIYLAIGDFSVEGTPNFLSNLKRLTTTGRILVSSLFGHISSNVSAHPRLVQLTHLELAITDRLSAVAHQELELPLPQYLPRFLTTMPNLTDLALHFPNPRMRRDENGPHQSRVPLYGSIGFNYFVDSVFLPNLTNLHFSHLRLRDGSPLRAFLYQHRKTLSQFRATSLSLDFSEWRPFMTFLAGRMELQWLIIETDFTPEEIEVVLASWEGVPEELKLKQEEFCNAAKKGTRFVSKQGEDVVFKGRDHNEH